MKDFYVQLTSLACKTEFPSNASNHLKNRLPHPLQFREPGWNVGMSSFALPEVPRKIKLNEEYLFRFWWIELFDPTLNIYTSDEHDVTEGHLDFAPRTGTEFMGDQAVVDLQLFKKKTKADDSTEWLYTVMNLVREGDCVIDNTKTCTTIQMNSKPRCPELIVGLELAKRMKWIVRGTLQNGQPGYVLGPHLRKGFFTGVVPSAGDVIKANGNGEEIFQKVDEDGLHLSCYINWVFVDVDKSYRQAFGSTRRALHLYSSVGQSTVTRNQVADLLREIPYALHERYFEPDTSNIYCCAPT